MTLIKKTIILSSTETEGYCTIIRVGNEIGAKIVGANFTSDMRIGIKIGIEKTYVDTLQGAKTEINLPLNFTQNDNIGCLILSDGNIFAKGGIYISKSDVLPTVKSTYIVEEVKPNAVVADTPVPSDDDNDILKKLGAENINFYATAKDKINELFIIYPPDNTLEALIPESKWIKISYDGDDYYVVGQLLNEGKLTYIGYGVPGIKAIQPPKITEGYADWLPVNNIKPYDGYWLIFQNAETGKMSNL